MKSARRATATTRSATTNKTNSTAPIQDSVRRSVNRYFKDLNGHQPQELYKMVLQEVEPPLLEVVMHRTGGNQTLASEMLGINRGTLRKKLKQYKLL
ncbi:MAG: DNA-binding transcriptional regulator Fis [Gammaproteobacteria bacterium]|nr:MAG: DNA-binding transcriptional regulator Fis [Gammaproteobacteria bacterium]